MKISLRNVTLILKISFLVLIAGLAAILLISGSSTQGLARTQGERVFENAIPKNAPIKIKIKKEKEQSFKELKNEKWVREFELEVVNTGDKPIFFLYLHLITNVDLGGSPLMFALVYGRPELGDMITRAGADDIPIKPGETYVFKIHSGQVPAWEMSLQQKSHPDASRIKAKLEVLSFGDGTGYFLNKPFPRSDAVHSKLDLKFKPRNKGGPKTLQTTERSQAKQFLDRKSPVSFLPANFLHSISTTNFSPSPEAVPSDNCLFEYCVAIVFSSRLCLRCISITQPRA